MAAYLSSAIATVSGRSPSSTAIRTLVSGAPPKPLRDRINAILLACLRPRQWPALFRTLVSGDRPKPLRDQINAVLLACLTAQQWRAY